ncbi:DMT family transporter [Achromobacter sp. GG226]|uniref:DMT family transporter n=1 Tax=Verticiella alkaliphila TaxID=2779529 RepID=UPI001C0DAA08|nr:DMT family transporter [Verticiella sp. GG226]MBU4611220.1 DMT family transporter [Verticiella sp. GG226]
MSSRRALTAIHVAAVLFGLTGVFGHAIQASPEAITLGRAAFAVIALALVARWQGWSLLGGLTVRRALALGGSGVLLAVHWVTFFQAVKLGGVAVATLGFASVPAFTVMLERVIYGDRIQRTELGLLALVTLGLILVAPTFDLRDTATVGLAWGVLSGFSFALLAIVNRWAARGLQALQVACWQNVAVAVLLLPFAGSQVGQVANIDWFWLALLGIFCTGLSHYLFVSSLARINARTAGMVIALEPVYAIAFAWLLFADVPSVRMLAGAACILGASVLTTLRQRTPRHA